MHELKPITKVEAIRDESYWRYRLLIAEIEALMDECGVPRKADCAIDKQDV